MAQKASCRCGSSQSQDSQSLGSMSQSQTFADEAYETAVLWPRGSNGTI
jgi:hypothetical protein